MTLDTADADHATRDRLEVFNPFDDVSVGVVPISTLKHVEQTAGALRAAQTDWTHTPIRERARAVARYGDWLAAHRDEIDTLLATVMAFNAWSRRKLQS